jgi:phenylglyoxylate dehydrogenase beta subunit
MEDLYDKLDKAIAASKRGFAYLHIYSPCTTGWRFPSQENIEVARKAVETNFVMLWDFNPRDGLRLSRPLDGALPIDEYLEALGKYRHLEPGQVAHIEATVEKNAEFIRGLAAGMHPAVARGAAGRA